MQLTKAVNIISKSAMSNSSKPHKDHQSMLYGAHVKKMAKTSTLGFMKGCLMNRETSRLKKK